MKKLLLMLLLSGVINAQYKDKYLSFSAGIDVRNAIVGSEPTNNNPALNYDLQFSMVGYNADVCIGFESFPQIDFRRYYFGIGYHFPLYGNAFKKQVKTTFIPSLQPSLIDRYNNWGGGLGIDTQSACFFSLGANLAFRWNINDKFALEYSYNALLRPDVSTMYEKNENRANINGVPIVSSNFIKVVYIFNR
jgi:hypothetical protein